MTEDDLKTLYESITVPIPGLDPSKAKAISFENFLHIIDLITKQSFLLGTSEGLKDAKVIVSETFKASRSGSLL